MTEQEISLINKYLPEGATYLVLPFFQQYPIHLNITKERKTILGNYCYEPQLKMHKITVNYNLNKFAFLVTLLHEIAHIATFVKHRHNVKPPGAEWKNNFKIVLNGFLANKIFPADIENQLMLSFENLKASSCADLDLAKVLKKYDLNNEENNLTFVQDLVPNDIFEYEEKSFVVLKKNRSRFLCQNINTKQKYSFYALLEVKKK